MEEIARWEGSTSTSATRYSDSASDLPMLEAVGHPVAVNPDAKLARHARAHGWPIVHLQPAHQVGDPPHRRGRRGAAGIAAGSFAAGTRLRQRRRHRRDVVVRTGAPASTADPRRAGSAAASVASSA